MIQCTHSVNTGLACSQEDALVRAHEKAMERYQETREDARRPDLGQRVADYHLGLTCRLGR